MNGRRLGAVIRLGQLHEHPRLVAWYERPAGRVLIQGSGLFLLWWHEVNAFMLAGALLTMLVPGRRRLLLSLTSVALLLATFAAAVSDDRHWPAATANAALVLALLWSLVRAARHFDHLPPAVRARPQPALHGLVWLLIGLLAMLPSGPLHEANVALIALLVWPAGYLLAAGARGSAAGTRFTDHLFYLLPVYTWGFATNVAKGFDYLSRQEAGDRESLARSQLAGIKLLLLAILWGGLARLMEAGIYGETDWLMARLLAGHSLDWPRLIELIAGPETGGLAQMWASLFLELIHFVLRLAAWGHVVIGFLRLAGFRVFRITYKPLLAESLIDFWSRLSYYFKEICVDFFFYPVFLRCQWAPPRLRLLLAVFAAAFFGNLYWHLLSMPGLLVGLDPAALWSEWSPRLIYCVLLASGIWVSMLRQRERRSGNPQAGTLPRVRRIAGVWLFYALLHVWNVFSPDLEADIGQRFRFLAGLFGL